MAIYLIDWENNNPRNSASQIAYSIDEARRRSIQYIKRTGKSKVRIFVAGRLTGDYAGDVVQIQDQYVWIAHRRDKPVKKYELNQDGTLGKKFGRL